MKRLLTRSLALMLSILLLLTCAGAEQAATARQSTLRLADGLVLQGSYLTDAGSEYDENVLYYAPGGDVDAVVAYGNTLYGRSTMDYIQDILKKQDLTVTAGINAAFFDMSSGVSYGMVVTDGLLRSSGSGNTIGIRKDGSFLIGDPELAVTLETALGEFQLNYNRPVSTGNGFCLYSRDYDYKTKNTLPAYHFIVEAQQEALTLATVMTLTVKEVVEETGSIDIPENAFVLSLAKDSQYAQLKNVAEALSEGDRLTVTASVIAQWADVKYAVGAGDMLVENGEACTEFTLDSAARKAARTAMGVTARGEGVFVTVDYSSSSDGMTLSALAERMVELGCVSAINLDGGGSTTMGSTLPGDSAFTTMNHPSEGQQRACANFIFFVRPTVKADEAANLHLYPYDAALLPGGSLELTVKATDASYMPTAVPKDVTFTAHGGTMKGNVFTADKAGTATVVAKSENAGGEMSILVVETPTTISVRKADRKQSIKSLIVEAGSTTELVAEADYLGASLSASNSSFTWEVEEEIGTVTEDGRLTAGDKPGKGTLTVSCGDLSVNISVEVREQPFTDTSRHWARNYIFELFTKGILNGSDDGKGNVTYRPEDSMTRQEFTVALMRYLNVNTDKYAEEELPFDDADKIAGWAKNAIRAAYKLGYFSGSQDGSRLLANPTSSINREQAMSILARTLNVTGDKKTLSQFADAGRVSSWAAEALAAMVDRGIVSGMDGLLQPQGRVTRAQVAKMLYVMGS